MADEEQVFDFGTKKKKNKKAMVGYRPKVEVVTAARPDPEHLTVTISHQIFGSQLIQPLTTKHE